MHECVIIAGVPIANEIMWVCPFMVLSQMLAMLHGYLSDTCLAVTTPMPLISVYPGMWHILYVTKLMLSQATYR